ncbi:MAG: LysR family transcriptional regulator [Oscillospiraceae bacterium]
MELRDIRYFVLAAEMEHISRAAEKLGVSQPFLTKVIKQLETELGAPLMDRKGRGVVLSAYGKAVYERAKDILAEVDAIYDDVAGLLGHEDRNVLFLVDSAGYIPDFISAYQARYPEKTLSIRYCLREEIINELNSCRADFALCTPPLSTDESIHIVSKKVYYDNGCVLLPPDSPLLGKKSVSYEDMRDMPLVGTPVGAGVRNNLEILYAKHGDTPKVAMEFNEVHTIIKSVMRGMGYAVMPQILLKDPTIGKYCRAHDTEFFADISLCWNKSRTNHSSTQEFICFVEEFFAELL